MDETDQISEKEFLKLEKKLENQNINDEPSSK